VCGFEVTMIWTPRDRYDWRAEDCKYIEDCNWSVERA